MIFDNAARQALCNRGFAHTGFTNIKRVILRPAAQNLNGAVDFSRTADQRIDAALLCLFVQIDGELVERAFFLVFLRLGGVALFLVFLFTAGNLTRLGKFAVLAYAVTDVRHRIETAHILLLEEINGVALSLGEQGNQHIRAGHYVLSGTLNMQYCALHHPLESAGRRWIDLAVYFQALQLAIEIGDNDIGQFTQIDTACLHDFRRIGIID